MHTRLSNAMQIATANPQRMFAALTDNVLSVDMAPCHHVCCHLVHYASSATWCFIFSVCLCHRGRVGVNLSKSEPLKAFAIYCSLFVVAAAKYHHYCCSTLQDRNIFVLKVPSIKWQMSSVITNNICAKIIQRFYSNSMCCTKIVGLRFIKTIIIFYEWMNEFQ